jgi:hypothetical protein
MFEKFMTEGAYTPYMMALCRARVDVNAGVLSVKDAARIYSVDAEIIEQFNREIEDYDTIQKIGGRDVRIFS